MSERNAGPKKLPKTPRPQPPRPRPDPSIISIVRKGEDNPAITHPAPPPQIERKEAESE